MEYPFIAALTIGLFSAVHCVGMCGGIMGALAFGLPQPVRADTARFVAHIAAYNSGRITSYAAAGAIAGWLGSGLGMLLPFGHLSLQAFAALLLAGTGLHLAGWFPGLSLIERLGAPLWRRLEPLRSRLMPVTSPWQALGYGMVWGWLPCGLVYTALVLAGLQGSAGGGALFMALFGMGTLPAVAGIGILAEHTRRIARAPWARRFAGIFLIVLALAGLLFGPQLHQLRADLPVGGEPRSLYECL